jgi:hypothetical protein
VLIYPSGKRVRVNRDTRGRLSGLDKVDSLGNVLGTYMSGVGYNVAGQVTGLSLGNGVSEGYGYSADRLQLTSQTATRGVTTLMSLTYNYAAAAPASARGSRARFPPGVTTHYVWEGVQVIAEYNGSTGALISEYVYAWSRMAARDQGGVLRYFHQDRLSTRLITDGTGTVVGRKTTTGSFAIAA